MTSTAPPPQNPSDGTAAQHGIPVAIAPASAAIIQLHEVSLDSLRPDPADPRRISDAELDALTRSLREFGFVQPVLARRDDGIVVGARERLVTAQVSVCRLTHDRPRAPHGAGVPR